ncbi:MAG: extensin family protein [Rhodobacteraceae bacterium]|nr:extensin family protein [Paracoccaceae bacterium]
MRPEPPAQQPPAQPAAQPLEPRVVPDSDHSVPPPDRGPTVSRRPEPRSGALERRADSAERLRRKGAVCGDIDIQGDVVGRVPSEVQGCGIKEAVRIRSVAGVTLSHTALLNCETAKALKTWVVKGVQPAFRGQGKVAQLQVAASYSCRPRNNVRGAKLSEHGKGNAIDISAFILSSGKEMSVLSSYARNNPLGASRRAACGIFGTVLGPGSDRYHSNHFHLDVARHRGGPYCH